MREKNDQKERLFHKNIEKTLELTEWMSDKEFCSFVANVAFIGACRSDKTRICFGATTELMKDLLKDEAEFKRQAEKIKGIES